MMLQPGLTAIRLASRSDRTTTLLRRVTAALPGRPVLPDGDEVLVWVAEDDHAAVTDILASLVGGLLGDGPWIDAA